MLVAVDRSGSLDVQALPKRVDCDASESATGRLDDSNSLEKSSSILRVRILLFPDRDISRPAALNKVLPETGRDAATTRKLLQELALLLAVRRCLQTTLHEGSRQVLTSTCRCGFQADLIRFEAIIERFLCCITLADKPRNTKSDTGATLPVTMAR